MRALFLLGALLALSPACLPPRPSGKPPKLPAYYPQVKVPGRITEGSYKNERDVFDALPIHTPNREPFRLLLLGHLLERADRQLQRRQEGEAFKSFLEAASLWHPAEVYLGRVREDRLAALARRLVSLYSTRGDEEHVLPALAVLLTLTPADQTLPVRFKEIASWVDETQQLAVGPAAKGAQLIKVLDRTAKAWPSAKVIESLRVLYLERQITLARAIGEGSFRHLRQAFPGMVEGTHLQTGYRMARLYLRVGRPYEALTRLREVSSEVDDTELRQLLETAISPSANVQDQLRLAEHFEQRDSGEVALRICESATQRFPEQASAYECLGRLAAALDRTYLAVSSLERATQLAPRQRPYAEALARQYQRRIFELIGEEQLEEAKLGLEKIEGFYRRSVERFQTPLKPPLGRVYYALGHGFYNAGRIDLAKSALQKSIATESSPDAEVQLAMIHYKRGQTREALEQLSRAERSPMSGPEERIFWKGRIEGLRGKVLDLVERKPESKAALERAVEAWQEWQSLGLKPEARAEALVYEAQSHFLLGEKVKAMDVLDRAIDVAPERKETYADVIALLATHGHLPEALDALHRALGRTEVSEYLKSYCSFWVVGMARRAGEKPDALALEHLRSLSGDDWYVRLAQLVLGQLSYEQLQREAKTVGKRAELSFYWADRLQAEGKLDEARELWKIVVETEMMAFFEYDMAAFNLRLGPARVTTRPLDRQPSPER